MRRWRREAEIVAGRRRAPRKFPPRSIGRSISTRGAREILVGDAGGSSGGTSGAVADGAARFGRHSSIALGSRIKREEEEVMTIHTIDGPAIQPDESSASLAGADGMEERALRYLRLLPLVPRGIWRVS